MKKYIGGIRRLKYINEDESCPIIVDGQTYNIEFVQGS